jgi:hypothetical protein
VRVALGTNGGDEAEAGHLLTADCQQMREHLMETVG